MPRFTHRKVIPIGATARVVVAQRAPETLTLVRHVPVELRGVVGHLDLDVPRVNLGLAPERLLDRRLDGLRAGRRPDGDEVPHPGHTAFRCRLPACAGVPRPASHGWVARAWRTPQVLREP
jgi:hypothetical protein